MARPCFHDTSRRAWYALRARSQAASKVRHDPTYPGVLVLRAVCENA